MPAPPHMSPTKAGCAVTAPPLAAQKGTLSTPSISFQTIEQNSSCLLIPQSSFLTKPNATVRGYCPTPSPPYQQYHHLPKLLRLAFHAVSPAIRSGLYFCTAARTNPTILAASKQPWQNFLASVPLGSGSLIPEDSTSKIYSPNDIMHIHTRTAALLSQR